MAAKVALATLVSLKGHVSEDEINQQKLKQKIEERKRRLKKAFNFYMSNTAHIEVVRNGNLEILFFSLFPYCKCFPKEEKQKF
jgi:inositol 1,4,5-triphosphate receptor type 1